MRRLLFVIVVWILLVFHAVGQGIPSPKEHFGFDIGDDYQLANFTQAEAYFKKVAELSDRVKYVDIGLTEEGRSQPMMIVTSPENHKKLDRYKEISQRLARAELSPEEAKALIAEGKPVVWIDGGLHSTETVGAHQLIETYYQLVSRKDEETLNILDKVIILMVHANPDGHELVADWYMSEEDPKKRNLNIPRLYEKYAGHDNNRDFYMNNLKESTNISKQQYLEWMPQIIYNHHQSGPAGTVVAGPPYRDPFNHALDPLLITGIDGVAAAMINTLNGEDKPGYTRLDGSVYSTWWNGGLRTAPYFHNMIGILTEIIGNPTPSEIPFIPQRLLANNDTPYPVMPQQWKFRQSIDYSVSLNYAILNYASNNGKALLFNIYKMGRNAIEKGSSDTWSLLPRYIAQIEKDYEADKKAGKVKPDPDVPYYLRGGIPQSYYDKIFADKALRDPRAFVLPADQEDFPRAIEFVNALIKSGIQIHQATADFTVQGKAYPKGSYIVKTAQAFRPHVLDMFEPQDHPNDFQYPGGPPVRPYDAAGWTLAYQMGLTFDRILEEVDGPFEAIPYGVLQTPTTPTVADSPGGYLLDARTNNTYKVANLLLKQGVKLRRLTEPSAGLPAGSFYVPAKSSTMLTKSIESSGISPVPVSGVDIAKFSVEVKPARVALLDVYGGSMPSGWVRFIMEKYNFPIDVIFPQDIDKGNLAAKYDVILCISTGIPKSFGSTTEFGRSRQPAPEEVAAEYRPLLGNITEDKSLPQLKKFLEAGGKIFTVGSSSYLAFHLGLPVTDALEEKSVDGSAKPLAGDKYYIPGSILQAKVASDAPAVWGMGEKVDLVFNNSPVFKLAPDAHLKGVKPLVWFADSQPLRSGWAWGQEYLLNGVAAFESQVGKGKLLVYGPEITFRAQSHGTFKFLFNELYLYNNK
ncbi:MAG TPA: M14 metallopeptidase family protein [Cyclobacteriaceae bacterium]|nr:M14 metallopeptidase family protein [Cyclobacteriaceae bacterium]